MVTEMKRHKTEGMDGMLSEFRRRLGEKEQQRNWPAGAEECTGQKERPEHRQVFEELACRLNKPSTHAVQCET